MYIESRNPSLIKQSIGSHNNNSQCTFETNKLISSLINILSKSNNLKKKEDKYLGTLVLSQGFGDVSKVP